MMPTGMRAPVHSMYVLFAVAAWASPATVVPALLATVAMPVAVQSTDSIPIDTAGVVRAAALAWDSVTQVQRERGRERCAAGARMFCNASESELRWVALADDAALVRLWLEPLGRAPASTVADIPTCSATREHALRVALTAIRADSVLVQLTVRCHDAATRAAPPSTHAVWRFVVTRRAARWVATLEYVVAAD
jgi:hypothetical protein